VGCIRPSIIPITAASLFESNLELIDRVIGKVCRRAGMFGADAEDFASTVTMPALPVSRARR
jgi:hypothetical protein